MFELKSMERKSMILANKQLIYALFACKFEVYLVSHRARRKLHSHPIALVSELRGLNMLSETSQMRLGK